MTVLSRLKRYPSLDFEMENIATFVIKLGSVS